MELALAALPGVVTSCLLVWILLKVLVVQNDERHAHRTEVAHAARALLEQVQMHRVEVDALTTAHTEQIERLTASHRQEIAALHQARVEEVSTLLQRIQAPDFAVAEHAGRNAGPDAPPLDLEDDLAMIEERERTMDDFARELEGRT